MKKILNFILNLFRRKDHTDRFHIPKHISETSGFRRGSDKAPINRSMNGFRKFKNTAPKQKKQKLGLPRFTKPCKMCKEPMYVAKGQIAFTHRDCRTMYRRIYAH